MNDIIWKEITPDIVYNIAPFYLINNYGEVCNKTNNTKLSVNDKNMCNVQNINGLSMNISVPRVMYMIFISTDISNNEVVWFKDNCSYNLRLDNLIKITRKELKDVKFNINVDNNSKLSDSKISTAQYYRGTDKIMFHYIDEVWTNITDKSVQNVKPWYKISNYGRIYSMATGCLVKTNIINSGYIRVQLRSNDDTKLDALVHRIMMIEFNPIENYSIMEVNHKDGNGFNNVLSNMNWLSKTDNAILKANTDNSEFYNNNFTEEQLINICESLQKGLSYKDICIHVLNTPYTSRMHTRLYDIHKRKAYTKISNNYTF